MLLLVYCVSLLSLHWHTASVKAWTTFIVQHNTSGADDIAPLSAAFTRLNGTSGDISTNATIIFKQGVTYNFFSAILFPILTNVEIRVEGNMSYLEDITSLQGIGGLNFT
jgi:hypothetical protein